MTISQLSIPDLPLFHPVFSKVIAEEFPGYSKKVIEYLVLNMYSIPNYHYWIENKLKTVFIAKDKETIAGFAVVDKPYGGVSFLRWLGILKHYQNKGYGSELVAHWLQTAADQGCHKAEVTAQPEAKGFYEKMGLKLEGLRNKTYFGIDQYLFGKVLGNPNDTIMIK